MPAVVAWEIVIVVVDVSCSVDVSCIVATDVSVLGIDVNVVLGRRLFLKNPPIFIAGSI